MSKILSILIVEDDAMIALGLAFAVEDAGAIVVGPAASTAEALKLLAEDSVDAAVLDVNLADRDSTPVALALLDRAVPFIVHTGSRLPAELTTAHPGVSLLMKPAGPNEVVARLLSQVPRGIEGVA